ncbi:MAG: hypothetical protein KAS38_13815 [Anaerolineales bacterium]|nr:hypothetical protein [Anaerolineales bacterium]
MSFAPVYPIWYWLYFAVGGSIAALFFVGVMWYKMKFIALAKEKMRNAAKWQAAAYAFLFMAAWST